jgi:hypothetical protein
MRLVAILGIFAMVGPDLAMHDALAVHSATGWQTWWRGQDAPGEWNIGHPVLLKAVTWQEGSAGTWHGAISVSGSGEAWRIKVLLVRFEPSRFTLNVHHPDDRLGRPDRWSVDDAPADAVVSFNGGQFDGGGPWGWLIIEGKEQGLPGSGQLASAVVQDTSGRLAIVHADDIPAVRSRGGITTAIQSYPAVLIDGEVPTPIQVSGMGLSHTHRDARLLLCAMHDGTWLVALTRFEGLGGALEVLPFGLTVPEMSALAGGLGCRDGVLLDGGLSGQLQLRGADGEVSTWRGLRKVPAGLSLQPNRG